MRRGSATTDHEFSYFVSEGRNCNTVYVYQWDSEKWKDLPQCRLSNFALVIVNGDLTTVGGRDNKNTDKIDMLKYTESDKRWAKGCTKNSACSKAAVVRLPDNNHIILIGGQIGTTWTSSVELFQMSSGKWFKLTKMPITFRFPSATICDNRLYVIGHDDTGYWCSLSSITSDSAITSQSAARLIVWEPLPPLPVKSSTIATLSGQLVAIGGKQSSGKSVNSIYQLLEERWVKIGSMSHARNRCLAVCPSSNKMLIVGGVDAQESAEECNVI